MEWKGVDGFGWESRMEKDPWLGRDEDGIVILLMFIQQLTLPLS
jgi:hypothetical protein